MTDLDPLSEAAQQIGRAADQMRQDEAWAAKSRHHWAELVTQADDLGVASVTTIALWSGVTPLSVRRTIIRAYRRRAGLDSVTDIPPRGPVRRPIMRVWRQADTAHLGPGTPLGGIHP